MSELPKGWVETTLTDVCELITDGTHHSPANGPVGDFKYVTAKNIRRHGLDLKDVTYIDSATHREIYKRCPVRLGDVLYIKDGATTGLAIVNPLSEEFSLLSSVALIRPSARLLDGHFLRYQLNTRSVSERMTGDMTGSAIRRLTLTTIGRQTAAVPPLAEQKRIVAKLDALNAKSARARSELARIETLVSRYKQAVLSKAFSGELTKEWRQREGQGSWYTSSADKLFKWSSGNNLPSREYRGGTIPVLGGNGVSGYHDTFNVGVPTIVIGRVGALCGNVFYSRAPSWVTDNAIYAKWISPSVDLAFSVLFYRFADLNKLSGGTGQPYVNQAILNSIEFPLPSVLEQHEIVRRIEAAFARIDRLAAEAKRALDLVGKLDEAILAKAFAGELVPQDPADEPADKLLERIRAEREAAPKVRRGRGRG